MEPSKRRKLIAPVGKCYQLAGELVLDTREGEVVHGQVWSPLHRQMIEHAWVEVPPGTEIEDGYGDKETMGVSAVIDLTLKKRLRLIPKSLYYALTKAEVGATYTVEEFLRMTLDRKTWGPWHSNANSHE